MKVRISHKGKMVLHVEYDRKTGQLLSATLPLGLTVEQLIFIKENLPITIDELEYIWKSRYRMFNYKTVEEDLSFNNFWNKYNYKVGNKARAEKLWEKLSDKDRVEVFIGVLKYDRYLSEHPGLGKAHATTFLNQRRWENEY